MISVRNLSKYFPSTQPLVPALKDINLDVAKGEIFGIIGRSGAGKSTLIRCINQLEHPSSGNVLIEGICITKMNAKALREARRQMGMIFQHFNLLQSRTVAENIALPLELLHKDKATIADRVDELLSLTELSAYSKQYPSQLSGGQKQRVAIARALANSPKVLLCDEATSSLDPQSTHAILDLLQAINEKMGITILLITHEMNVVKAICHRVGIIHHGKIIEERRVVDLFTNPHTDVAKALVKTASRMEVPPVIKSVLQDSPSQGAGTIIRIAYVGDSASEPIIGHLIEKYHISVNILQGNIETIQGQIVGVMIVEIRGEDSRLEQSMAYLEENGLHVEILGYVQRNH